MIYIRPGVGCLSIWNTWAAILLPIISDIIVRLTVLWLEVSIEAGAGILGFFVGLISMVSWLPHGWRGYWACIIVSWGCAMFDAART